MRFWHQAETFNKLRVTRLRYLTTYVNICPILAPHNEYVESRVIQHVWTLAEWSDRKTPAFTLWMKIESVKPKILAVKQQRRNRRYAEIQTMALFLIDL